MIPGTTAWMEPGRVTVLRDALVAAGTNIELRPPDTVVALETTSEAVGLIAAGAGVAVFEMTAQHFDLEEFFLALTTDPKEAR